MSIMYYTAAKLAALAEKGKSYKNALYSGKNKKVCVFKILS